MQDVNRQLASQLGNGADAKMMINWGVAATELTTLAPSTAWPTI